MDLELGIVWAIPTEFASILISSNDPRYETGFRQNLLPYPDSHPQDEMFREMKNALFKDGPKLKFIPSHIYSGSISGYVFYLGEFGLGYYIDPIIMRQIIYA
jgi:hypothetical protein